MTPATPVIAASDPDDDIFLECAEAAEANYVITGNTKHFPGVWAITKVVTVRQCFETIASTEFGAPQSSKGE